MTMVAIEYRHLPPNGRMAPLRLFGSIRRLVARAQSRGYRRRTLRLLSALDRHHLRDLGLSSADRSYVLRFGFRPTADGRPPVQHL